MKFPFAAPLALACGIAFAQPSTIYRCGDSYSSRPCTGGREIAAETPSPTSAERRDAAAAAQRDARIADGLEKERLKQEARPAAAYIPAPEPAQPSTYKPPEKAATRKLDVFTASAPGTGKADKKKDKPAKGPKKGKPTQADKAAKPAKDARSAPAGRLGTSVQRSG